MQRIRWEDFLSRNNRWSLRLLGVEPFQQRRTVETTTRNYDVEIYGEMLKRYQGDIEALRRSLREEPDKPWTFSLKDELFSATWGLFRQIERGLMRQVFDAHAQGSSLCELGAGWGQNLGWIGGNCYGGEFSRNAVELGRLLGYDVQYFNYYDHETYRIIRPGTTVLTKHSVEQIPDASVVVAGLKTRREHIGKVIHFEPVYRDSRNDLFGLIRNRYAQLNDYNTNLLACLEADREVEILHFEADMFGVNPLNPTSVIVWKFI